MADQIDVGTVTEVGLLKKRALNGLFFLGLRRIIVQIILTGGNIILARLLFPQVFGTFAIALGVVNLLAIFAGLGLEPALVQKKEDPQKEELQSTFTVTLLLSLMVTLLIMALAPLLYRFYQEQLGENGVFYLRLLSLSVLGSGLKGISGVLLTRRLDYTRAVLGEILEILILQVSTVALAFRGFGVLSFIWGMLLSRLLGFVIFFLLAPWPIGLKFSLKAVREIIPFGVNFQLSTIIGGLNGAVVPIFVGKVSGSAAVGLLNWAGGVAVFPRAMAEILGQLTFPVGSRTQDNKRLLRLIIEKSIQFSCLSAFPMVTILAALAHPLTYIIYTDKWIPGIPALYFFSLQSIFLIIGGVLTQTLLALGEAKTFRNISLFWAILQWVLTVPLVFKFGFTGLAMAGALVSATFFVPLILLRKKVKFEIGPHVWPYLGYSLVAGGAAFWLNQRYPAQSIWDLLLMAIFGGIIYLALIFTFKRKEIIEDIFKVKRILMS